MDDSVSKLFSELMYQTMRYAQVTPHRRPIYEAHILKVAQEIASDPTFHPDNVTARFLETETSFVTAPGWPYPFPTDYIRQMLKTKGISVVVKTQAISVMCQALSNALSQQRRRIQPSKTEEMIHRIAGAVESDKFFTRAENPFYHYREYLL